MMRYQDHTRQPAAQTEGLRPLQEPGSGARFRSPVQEPGSGARFRSPVQEPGSGARFRSPVQEQYVKQITGFRSPVHCETKQLPFIKHI